MGNVANLGPSMSAKDYVVGDHDVMTMTMSLMLFSDYCAPEKSAVNN